MVPISATERVKHFLKDDNFLLTSPNAYNQLGVGTTQLYNITVVYNHKYHGTVELGGRHFEFRRKDSFPKNLSGEFLLVDLMNNLKTLAEDHEAVRAQVGGKALQLDQQKLEQAVKQYGSVTSQEYFGELFANANRGAD